MLTERRLDDVMLQRGQLIVDSERACHGMCEGHAAEGVRGMLTERPRDDLWE